MTREQAIELARRVRGETIASGEHVEIVIDDDSMGTTPRAFITYEWVIRAIMEASKR